MTMLRFVVAGLLAVCPALVSLPALAQSTINVVASESFRVPLQALGARYAANGGEKTTFMFGSSADLAEPIRAGRVDIVAIAMSWTDTLEKEGWIQKTTRKDLLGDHLILYAPAAHRTQSLVLTKGTSLAAQLGGKKLAIADPDETQTGRYSKASLQALGMWDSVSHNLLLTENVRSGMAAVTAGKAALGIAYQTTLQGQTAVRAIGQFPDESHPPIVYSFALVKNAKPAAQRFMTFLQSPEALATYAKAGFVVRGQK